MSTGLCVDPLGELTVLPESHSWIKGEKEGEGGRGREGSEREVEGKGRGKEKNEGR